MSSLVLRGGVALVTGASRGIGLAIARRLAAEGMSVALVARGAEALEQARAALAAAGARAVGHAGDVGDPSFCRAVVLRVEAELGPVDVLVNNAGVGVFRPFLETTADELEGPLKVPVLAAMVLSQACLPGMLERRRGAIVNLTSIGGKISIPRAAAYSAGRFGITGFTHSLQEELHGSPVKAILICPSEVATEYFAKNRSTTDDLPRARRLFRVLTAEQVAEATARAIRSGRELVVIPVEAALYVRLYQAWPRLGRFMLRVLG